MKGIHLYQPIKNYHSEKGGQFVCGKESFREIQNYYKNNPQSYDVTPNTTLFVDSSKRNILFKGINIAAKTPIMESVDIPISVNDHVSFFNSPFPLEDAQIHFSRLKHLGFNLLRWVIPWEAICPNTPNEYDHDYLEYLDQMLAIAKNYGFFILIDFHQDVWSRYTGGSGAPAWTMDAIGMDIDNFEACCASINYTKRKRVPLGHLFWATNADRYAAKTMYTLFFGGGTYAPNFLINGDNVQYFLQDNYIKAISACAKKINHHSHIIGYDLINEPHLGYIGNKNLSKYSGLFRLGPSPLPIQSFALAEGYTQSIDIYQKKLFSLKKTSTRKISPNKKSVWKDKKCIWRKEGIWDINDKGEPVLLRKQYFYTNKVNEHFYIPFLKKASKALMSINSTKVNFIEPISGHPLPNLKDKSMNLGFSGHWYDAFVISMRKVWKFISVDILTHRIKLNFPYFIEQNLSMQISRLTKRVLKKMGDIPFILTEFGIPFDLNKKKAYLSGNFIKQKEGLDRSFKAIEKNLISSIIWNYTSSNSNKKGDLWNKEDFSIFSIDQVKFDNDPYSGVRAKEALVRPYPVKIPGTLTYYLFDYVKGEFKCTFTHNSSNSSPLEIFLPALHFNKGFEVQTTPGRYEISFNDQLLYFFPDSNNSKYHKVNIYKNHKKKKPKKHSFISFLKRKRS